MIPTPKTLADRTAAENLIATVITWDEPHLALLYQTLRRDHWTDERARTVLAKAHWLL